MHRSEDTAAAKNQAEAYRSIDRYIGEIYDQVETERGDIDLILSLVGTRTKRILEPFCGSGRLLIPLSQAGHEVVGLDLSEPLLEILAERVQRLPQEIRSLVEFRKADVIADAWPTGFDVVVLGCNCFYELATPEEQEHCVQAAASSLVSGGWLYLDNNHMEGDLHPSWCDTGGLRTGFPSGLCADGTKIAGTMETTWYDAPRRLVRFRRTVTVERPDGTTTTREWNQQKHPPSTEEMRLWLDKHGFVIEDLWGNRDCSAYSSDAPRAVFWARKP